MNEIKFDRKNVKALNAELTAAKLRMRELMAGGGSVVRYNDARETLKQEFPVEVIGMLDASGFIRKVLSVEEKKWLAERKRGGKI